MTWNWQFSDWPNFKWDKQQLYSFELVFLKESSMAVGATRYLDDTDRQSLSIELMCTEALNTSEIEGEYLNRDSVQSSIRRALGLTVKSSIASKPSEMGIANMMVDLYNTWSEPLTKICLFRWHSMLMQGRNDLECIGEFRTHADTMQIVSGPDYARKIHFEAPPSARVSMEMEKFLSWYEKICGKNAEPLTTLTRAGLAHIWFESIHPFEDGNGRIGRAIAEKILSQRFEKNPCVTSLAKTLMKKRKNYYAALNAASKNLDVTEWLLWFAQSVIEAQRYTLASIDFIVNKTKLLDDARGKLNARQEKALLRMLHEGPDGFVGGLSAANYMSITGTTTATTSRDLSEMVEMKLLKRVGEQKGARYFLIFMKVPE